jgi:hypothetical protein
MTSFLKSLFVLVFLGMSFAIAPNAEASDPFTVVGVPVDATGQSAIEAQTMAIREGQVLAAQYLLERLTLASQRAAKPLPELNQDVVARMIRALEIANEKRSANRYLGDITVAFNPREIQAFLQAQGLSMITSQSRERIVLPYYQGSLDPQSSWFQSWVTSKYAHSLTPVKIIPQEKFNLVPRSADIVRSMSPAELADLGRSLGAQQILITDGYDGFAGFDAQTLDISVDTGERRDVRVDKFALGGMSYADAIVNNLENEWKRNTVTLASEAVTMAVSVLYRSQSEWQQLKSAIDGSAQIQDARLDAMSKDGALMSLTYGGDMERLRRELAFKGVEIRNDPKLGMILTRSGRR